jgi:benzoyl-CoA reductase/2-hydroxyglutaryl-CoA dehydratase subunit BcrC/BadD/HgdB
VRPGLPRGVCRKDGDMNTEGASPAMKLSALDELTNLPVRGKNPHIQEWKRKGGKVFGYTCSYVPEEMLYAEDGPARFLPVRMGAQGCETTEDADVYMHRFMCSFVRSLMQMGLTGEYGFLDGVIITSCCEHMRKTYELWRDHVKPPFLAMVSVPHRVEGDRHFRWYQEEIVNLQEEIGNRYGYLPSRNTLRESIKTYNKYRELMAQLYGLRAIEHPKLTGAEALKIAQAGFSMPKELFNEKLEAAIEEIKERPGVKDCRARIMVGGSYMDTPLLMDVIESTDAIVVTDSLCAGRKYVEGRVEETGDPMEALARRYFSRLPCPRMIGGYRDRVEFTRKLAREAKVDGVVFVRIPFCDHHGVENLMETRDLEESGIPTLNLEKEYLAEDKGRLKTRIQAFLEKIGR